MSTRPARWRLLPGLALALALAPGASGAQSAPDLPEDPTLDDFVRVAEARSPSLESRRRLWRAETEAADAAGSFPDPQLAFAWYAEAVETRVGPQRQRISVRQRLPWFGKLGLRGDVADEGAGAARARYDDRRIELRRDVTLAWLDLYWIGRATELTRDNLSLLVDLERVIRERYRIGRVGHADLVRIQVELGVTENQLRSLEDRVRPAVARMNALLHRPDDARVPLPTELAEGTSAPDEAAVLTAVRRGSQRLRERERKVAQAGAARRLADRSRWPDWMVAADWIRTDEALDPSLEDSGKDPVVVSLTVELPLFRGKWDAPARAADERLVAAEADLASEEDALRTQAEDVLYAWRDADRRLDLYADALLPKARESYEALSAAYRTGQGAFLDLVDAARTLLDFELERERALTDRTRSAAKLRYLTGEPDGGDTR
jgi:outer membrane protein TolC